MKPAFVPPGLLPERPLPASRFLSYPESAAANTPMRRFVPVTKPASPSGANETSSTKPTAPSATVPDGTTTIEGS